MKKLLLFALFALAVAQAKAAELNWMTDLPAAQAKAKAEKKRILMNFTGSDWCGWCIRLKREVFDTPKFAAYAQKNLVLVEVDFPNKKKQNAALKKANQALQDKYKVEGYPTLIVLDGNGKKLGQLGYVEGGPAPFLAELEKLK
jgi:thioredoxin-related protein